MRLVIDMKVTDKTQTKVKFSEVLEGQTFFYEGGILYMRVRPDDFKNVEYNVVSLGNGLLSRFQAYAEVIPCTSEVIVTERGRDL